MAGADGLCIRIDRVDLRRPDRFHDIHRIHRRVVDEPGTGGAIDGDIASPLRPSDEDGRHFRDDVRTIGCGRRDVEVHLTAAAEIQNDGGWRGGAAQTPTGEHDLVAWANLVVVVRRRGRKVLNEVAVDVPT